MEDGILECLLQLMLFFACLPAYPAAREASAAAVPIFSLIEMFVLLIRPNEKDFTCARKGLVGLIG